MNQYVKKPVVIEAVQITDATFDDPHPNPTHIKGVVYDPIKRIVEIHTLEGTMTAQVGDWIIKGIQGELYPCKPDIFEQTYESIEQAILDDLPLSGSGKIADFNKSGRNWSGDLSGGFGEQNAQD